jgi:peptidoglycan/LPS O-acetylase OafA/YrhL
MHDRRQIPGIHLLRLGASLVIAAYHADVSGIAASWLPWLATLAGPRSVAPSLTSLFLTVSGFGLYYADATRRPGPERTARDFWRARAARLVPLMLVGHALSAPFLLMGASRYAPAEALARAGLVVTSTQSWYPPYALSFNVPAWTLSVLAFGYLLYPRIAARVGRLAARPAALLLATLWLASIGVSRLVLLGGAGGADTTSMAQLFTHVFPPIRVLEFASGVVLGRMWILAGGQFTRTWAVVALAPALLLVGLLSADLLLPRPAVLLGYGGLMPLWWVLLWLIAAIRLAPGRMKWAQSLGRASFAVYILHVPLLVVVNAMLHRGWFGAYGGAALGFWFVTLVPVGLAAEHWFVAPVARRLQSTRAHGAGRATPRAEARGVPGRALPAATRDARIGAGEA